MEMIQEVVHLRLSKSPHNSTEKSVIMNNTNTNTILLHANGVQPIDDQTLVVDVPGGTLTLIFASCDVMRNAAAVIIAATDRPAPGTRINVDEVTAGFRQSSIGLIPRKHVSMKNPELEPTPDDRTGKCRPRRRTCRYPGCKRMTHLMCSHPDCRHHEFNSNGRVVRGVFFCPQHWSDHVCDMISGVVYN